MDDWATATWVSPLLFALLASAKDVAFPEGFGPFDLAPTGLPVKDLSLAAWPGDSESFRWTLAQEAFPRHVQVILRRATDLNARRVSGQLSPMRPLTLDPETLRRSGVPEEAVYFAWSYPIALADLDGLEAFENPLPPLRFLLSGGFVFFDAGRSPDGIWVPVPEEYGGLLFAGPYAWTWSSELPPHRYARVTDPQMRRAGAHSFTWLPPGQKLQQRTVCRHGCFAFLFHPPGGEDEVGKDRFFRLQGADLSRGNATTMLVGGLLLYILLCVSSVAALVKVLPAGPDMRARISDSR